MTYPGISNDNKSQILSKINHKILLNLTVWKVHELKQYITDSPDTALSVYSFVQQSIQTEGDIVLAGCGSCTAQVYKSDVFCSKM
jgi:hypothetical protein